MVKTNKQTHLRARDYIDIPSIDRPTDATIQGARNTFRLRVRAAEDQAMLERTAPGR